jgi:hypothetical protein
MKHTKDRLQTKAQEITGTVKVSNLAGIESLMKRGYLELEDGKWNDESNRKNEGYFDKVLDIDPEYAPAYVGKLCVDLSVYCGEYKKFWEENDYFTYTIKKEADLARYYKPLDDEPNYQKAIRFADDEYRARLEGFNSEIKKRIEEIKNKFAFFMIIQEVANDTYDNEYISRLYGVTLAGSLKPGVRFTILRNEEYYTVYSYQEKILKGVFPGVYLCEKGEYEEYENRKIKRGDIAVMSHEILREFQRDREELERKRLEQHEAEEKAAQLRRKEEQRREEEEKRREEQSKQWEQQGLCRHCGGKLSLFGRKCKFCSSVYYNS